MYFVKFKPMENEKYWRARGIIPMRRYPVVADQIQNDRYKIVVWVDTHPQVFDLMQKEPSMEVIFDGFVEPKPEEAISKQAERPKAKAISTEKVLVKS